MIAFDPTRLVRVVKEIDGPKPTPATKDTVGNNLPV
jgi:hypothetical protein